MREPASTYRRNWAYCLELSGSRFRALTSPIPPTLLEPGAASTSTCRGALASASPRTGSIRTFSRTCSRIGRTTSGCPWGRRSAGARWKQGKYRKTQQREAGLSNLPLLFVRRIVVVPSYSERQVKRAESHSPQVIFLLLSIMFPHKARRKSVGVRVTALGKIRKRKLRRQTLVSHFMTRHRSLRQWQGALRQPRALLLPNHLQNLAFLNRLFAVGQGDELAIHRVQFAAPECEAQLLATQSESMTAGMLA